MTKTKAEFEIIVYGASGFTGRLVAEYLAKRGSSAGRWPGGVPETAEVRRLIGAPKDTPLVEADASAPETLTAMCNRARVIITTCSGPDQLYGPELVKACAAPCTDGDVDLCGEPAWMRHMIDAHDETAKDRVRGSSFHAASIRSPSILELVPPAGSHSAKRSARTPRQGSGSETQRSVRRHNREPYRNDEGQQART